MVYRVKLVSACLSMVGMASLCYIMGAGAMFYQLPSTGWLAQAFAGARVWNDRHPGTAIASEPSQALPDRSAIDRPEKTFDGFTFYTCAGHKDGGTKALLINMRREVMHRWEIPFSRVWPSPVHLDVRPRDSAVCFFGSHLYSNGDLLVVFHGPGPHGFGLAKLDKESNVLWAYPALIHHDVDVAEDGTIFAIQNEVVEELPPGQQRIATPCIVDSLLALTPDGKLLREPISILAALADSPYAAWLAPLERPVKRHLPPSGSTAARGGYVPPDKDLLHTNCIRVLRGEMATAFPNFKPGHLLISMRNLSMIAMLDPATGRIEWATRGPWAAQHDAQFLKTGHLLIFDNLGSPLGSRVLEYDPQTQAVPWSYAGDVGSEFYTSERGMAQRLPNGNTFIVDSEGGEMFEVTHDKEVVWSYAPEAFITTARRYGGDQVPFLDGAQHARP